MAYFQIRVAEFGRYLQMDIQRSRAEQREDSVEGEAERLAFGQA
ncbi:MAG: hypothetical protein ACREC4_07210 [Methylocella sp.]